jgi:pimeloyl-ACP methyl ester carboxylesterase
MVEDLSEEAQLRRTTDAMVEDMLAAGVVQKTFVMDERVGEEYWILSTPQAFEKRFVAVAALGYPEQVGIWSHTLLRQGQVGETSMEPYFRRFAEHDLGLVAINPNCLTPDIEGSSFLYQLDRAVAQIPAQSQCSLIGFSMGGGMVLKFLDQHPAILERMAGLVLIDPTLQRRLNLDKIRALLERDTLLIASEGEEFSPGKMASALLDIPAVSFPGIHGQMPNKALDRIMVFLQERGR